MPRRPSLEVIARCWDLLRAPPRGPPVAAAAAPAVVVLVLVVVAVRGAPWGGEWRAERGESWGEPRPFPRGDVGESAWGESGLPCPLL